MIDILSLAPTVLKGAIGAGQVIGSLLGKNERPEYEIPDSVRQALAMAQVRFNDPYADGYAQEKDAIETASANALQAASRAGNVTESVATVQSGNNRAMQQLSARGAQQQQQDFANLQQQLGIMGAHQDKQFQLNEMAPYADKAQEKRDVFGGGLENIMMSLEELGVMGGLERDPNRMRRGNRKSINNMLDIMSSMRK